jgi:hypothetical protein
MKKLLDIILEAETLEHTKTIVEDFATDNSNTIIPLVTTDTVDRIGLALHKLDQICEMADDLYNTISHLKEIDAEADAAITSTYNSIDDLYTKIDDKYDVIPVDLDEFTEDETVVESFRPGEDFVPAPIGSNTFSAKGLMKLWGLKMRSGKWADTFIGLYKDGKFSLIDTANDTETKYSKGEDVLSAIAKMAKEGIELLGDSLNEVLSKDSSSSEWINDFLNSDAPQFAGKSKKERINMALGAYYAAQKKEDLDESFRPGHDMVPAPIGKDTYQAKGLRKLWGIQMRGGKWADNFVGMYDDGKIGIFTQQGVNRYSTVADFEKAFAKFRKTGKLDESLELEEEVNMPKIKELVSLALIDEKDVAPTIAALKASQSNKALTSAQIKLLGNLAVMLTNVILGDVSALSSVKRAAKE